MCKALSQGYDLSVVASAYNTQFQRCKSSQAEKDTAAPSADQIVLDGEGGKVNEEAEKMLNDLKERYGADTLNISSECSS